MLNVTPKNVVIIRSSAKRRCILLETADPGLVEALGEVGPVVPISGHRYELHVPKLHKFGEVKEALKAWQPARPSLPELVAELTTALETALPYVKGVDTAVLDQWQQTAAHGRASIG